MKGTLNIRLDTALRKDLETLSKEERVPLSDMVRESIRQYVAVRRFRKLRKKALPFAEAQGILTDEDVFKLIS
jgi:predicted transcriptional regulator